MEVLVFRRTDIVKSTKNLTNVLAHDRLSGREIMKEIISISIFKNDITRFKFLSAAYLSNQG